MKNKFLIILLCVSFIITYTACEKDTSTNETIQKKFSAPSIESAKQFFDQNNIFLTRNGIQSKNSQSILQTDWQSSKTKDYKETPEQDIDILYTPIYLNTDRDAKAYIASTEQNGNLESKIVFVLYKSTNGQSGLSAYVFVYNLNGTLELEYNFDNGQSIPFQTDSFSAKTDCAELPNLNVYEIMDWLYNCTIVLDEVVVVATLDSGPSASGGYNADIPSFIHIPYIEDQNSGNVSSPSSGGVNPQVIASNKVSATGFSISMALGLSFSSVESQWLTLQAINNQSLLNAIAQFLNANKERPIDSAFNNVNPSQLPNINQEAVNFISEIINHLSENPEIEYSNIDVETLMLLANLVVESPENPIEDMALYLECFDRQQPATITISADQPSPDNPGLPISISDSVGHAFITINQGNNTVSFGFYPKNGIGLLGGTDGTMNNDQGHVFDVSITNSIDAGTLAGIIDYSIAFSSNDYWLIYLNCTTFAFQVSEMAGFDLDFSQCTSDYRIGDGATPGMFGEHLRNIELPEGATRNLDGGFAPQNNGCQ